MPACEDQTLPCQDELSAPEGQDQTRCMDPQVNVQLHQDEDAQRLGVQSALILLSIHHLD